VRDQEGDIEGVDLPVDPEQVCRNDLAQESENTREPGRDREDDPRAREAAPLTFRLPRFADGRCRDLRRLALLVEREGFKLRQFAAVAAGAEDRGRVLGGVLRDRPAVECRFALEVRLFALLAAAGITREPTLLPLPLGVFHEGSIGSGVATIARPASRGSFSEMPNIKQQEKRVRQAARQRQENLPWRSTAKTLIRHPNHAGGADEPQDDP